MTKVALNFQKLYGWSSHFERRDQEMDLPVDSDSEKGLDKLRVEQKRELDNFRGSWADLEKLQRKHADSRQGYERRALADKKQADEAKAKKHDDGWRAHEFKKHEDE